MILRLAAGDAAGEQGYSIRVGGTPGVADGGDAIRGNGRGIELGGIEGARLAGIALAPCFRRGAVAAPGASGALIVVLAAWVLGSFAGGATAARIARMVATARTSMNVVPRSLRLKGSLRP